MSRLAAAAFPSVSPVRVGAWSTVLSLHLAALALLLIPATPALLNSPPTPTIVVHFIQPEVVPVAEPPPMPAVPTRPQTPPTPTPVVRKADPVVTTNPTPMSFPALPVDPAPFVDTGTADPGPAQPVSAASVAYDKASPPPYPRMAIQKGWEGTVMLLVLVGQDGRVLEVDIDESSGHSVLDRAAREHVRKRWTFHPAMYSDGPRQAWAKVPVRFSLPN